jgi:hypothetical protein
VEVGRRASGWGDIGTSQQTIKQQARRTAREMAEKRRRERAERERRLIDLAERVMSLWDRDAAVAETEKRAGAALRELTAVEGLSLNEAVEWCGEAVTEREATRLRGLPDGDQDDSGGGADSATATAATAESGGAGAGTAVG